MKLLAALILILLAAVVGAQWAHYENHREIDRLRAYNGTLTDLLERLSDRNQQLEHERATCAQGGREGR